MSIIVKIINKQTNDFYINKYSHTIYDMYVLYIYIKVKI